MKNGYQRVKVDGEFYELEDAPKLDKKFKHDIDVVVDRIVVREGMEQRLAESFETALNLAQGIAIAEFADKTDARQSLAASHTARISPAPFPASQSRKSSRAFSPSTTRSVLPHL